MTTMNVLPPCEGDGQGLCLCCDKCPCTPMRDRLCRCCRDGLECEAAFAPPRKAVRARYVLALAGSEP